MVYESPPFDEPFGCCPKAISSSTRSGAVDTASVCLVLANARPLKRESTTSEEAKFTRERCIRVVAIVIMITPGVSNNCGVKKNLRTKGLPSETTTKHTACNGSSIWN